MGELAVLAENIQKIWGELKDVPEPVTAFLTKAARREATFADLTPQVRKWLEEHGLISHLRIGLG